MVLRGAGCRPFRLIAVAVAVLLGSVPLAGCVPVQPLAAAVEHHDDLGTPVGDRPVSEGGHLVMGLSAEPDKLDPTTSTSLYTRYVMTSICEKLYDLDRAGTVVPQLAAGLPTVSPDRLTGSLGVR